MKNQTVINKNKNVRSGGVKWYREKIVEMVEQIENEKLLKRIYNLAEYLYIYK